MVGCSHIREHPPCLSISFSPVRPSRSLWRRCSACRTPRPRRCSPRCVGPRRTARRYARHCGGLNAYDAAARMARRASVAALARPISRSPRGRCSLRTSCRCAAYLAAIAIFLQRGQGQGRAGALSRSRPVLQGRVGSPAQAARGDGRGNEGPRRRRRGQGRRDRRRLFRRLRQAGELGREPRRSSPRPQSERQAQGRRHRARAQWRVGPGRVPHRRSGALLDQARIAKGTVVNADEATSWDGLDAHFEVKRINHQEAY